MGDGEVEESSQNMRELGVGKMIEEAMEDQEHPLEDKDKDKEEDDDEAFDLAGKALEMVRLLGSKEGLVRREPVGQSTLSKERDPIRYKDDPSGEKRVPIIEFCL